MCRPTAGVRFKGSAGVYRYNISKGFAPAAGPSQSWLLAAGCWLLAGWLAPSRPSPLNIILLTPCMFLFVFLLLFLCYNQSTANSVHLYVSLFLLFVVCFQCVHFCMHLCCKHFRRVVSFAVMGRDCSLPIRLPYCVHCVLCLRVWHALLVFPSCILCVWGHCLFMFVFVCVPL